MTDLSKKIVEAGARAAAREACSAADVDAWVDAHWPMYVGEVEAAILAVLPIVGDDLAKAAETKAIRLWGDRFDIDDITSSLRTRLSEIMDGLK